LESVSRAGAAPSSGQPQLPRHLNTSTTLLPP
jgi:hypothetical protein